MSADRPGLDLADLLRLAGLEAAARSATATEATIEVQGREVSVRLEGGLCSMATTEQLQATTPDLELLGLSQPGDTSVLVSGDEAVVSRILPGPDADDLRGAVHGLVKAAAIVGEASAQVAVMLESVEAEPDVVGAIAGAPEPEFESADHLVEAIESLAIHIAVHSPQPAWSTGDQSVPPVAQLVPGTKYEAIDINDGIVRVFLDDGSVVHTNAAPLIWYQ